jgi:hypothetical protein
LCSVWFYSYFIKPLRIGLILQALAPILFLINILASVSAKKKLGVKRVAEPIQELVELTELSKKGLRLTTAMRRMYRTLGDSTIQFETDSVAQRVTDLSLMFLIGATFWMAFSSFSVQNFSSSTFPNGAIILLYYGWIVGTVLSVSLHLYQRYASASCLRKLGEGEICFAGIRHLPNQPQSIIS